MPHAWYGFNLWILALEIRERLRKPTKQGFSTWVENRVGTREYTRSVGCGRGMREVEEMISLPICGCGLAN